MQTYLLRKLIRSAVGATEPVEETKEIEARDEREAVAMAQAIAAEADGGLLAIELKASDQRVLWSLRRGATVSLPSDDAP